MRTTRNALTKAIIAFLTVIMILQVSASLAQASKAKKRILVDIAHGQRFYNDPAAMSGKDSGVVERIKYMTGELAKTAASLGAEMDFQKGKITPDALAKCDLLFIHMPSSKYDAEEVGAIQKYLQKGGSLFIVMEVDYWATLAQANVNDIVEPFGIVYKSDNPDGKSSGGYADAGAVAAKRIRIPYHGARIVEGGTPFCFSNQTKEYPFGIYKEVGNSGKIIAMGEGMVSLYMTSWEGVTDYQCSEFMHDAFAWLLK
ncbi:MAG TPA: hypothetical protein VM871_12205 [Flavisolibacter sp.]|nr:hypothetical protein [Flavisolibacter sp.]